MVEKVTFLLIGNSRLHWAENFQNNYKYFHTDKINSFPKNINVNNIVWASVGKFPTSLLKKQNKITVKDMNLKNVPNYFGIDRAFGCLEALKIIENPMKRNLIVADFGTTLSITKLNAQGSIIGGQIVPGFLTQLKSIEQYTKNLKAPKNLDILIKDFLIKTEDAMLKGVFNSLKGLINLSFDPLKDILIICGGDSQLIGTKLKQNNKEIIIAPNLVMQGMISHFNS